eukprot:5718584-Ditylum_brightwellii.AAC.1
MEKAEQKFKNNHEYINSIPYVLEASNINMTFLEWAEELNIDTPTGSKASNKASKHPKTVETIIKSNPKLQKRCHFKPSHPFNQNQQYEQNRVNKIDDEDNTKEEASDNEQEQYKKDTDTENLCHINATEYKGDSDNEEYGYNTNNIDISLQQTSRI